MSADEQPIDWGFALAIAVGLFAGVVVFVLIAAVLWLGGSLWPAS